MVKRRFWHLLCCLVALASLVVCRPALANDMEVERVGYIPGGSQGYNIEVEVERTVDADGWDEAYIEIDTKWFSGRGRSTTEWERSQNLYYIKSDNLADKFDDWKNTTFEEDTDLFPYKVSIYTDFGGGMSWRSWEADVTVFINDINVASKHITASSAPFSSSDEWNTIWIDEAEYPYPVRALITAPESVETEDEGVELGFDTKCYDQYGNEWMDPGSGDVSDSCARMTLEDSAGNVWERKYLGWMEQELSWLVSHKGPTDERVTYTLAVSTGNSVETESVATFDIDYHYVHKVEIIKDGKVISSHTGSMDEELPLDFPELVEPGYAIDWTLEGGGTLVPNYGAVPKYIFGDSDGTLTATSKPYSYMLVLDGNGATGGKMGERVMSVGKSYLLPTNVYAKTGHQFVGWSTEPDGSGDFYQNKGVVKDLATEDGAVVTLYAQWKVKSFTVTFVNKLTGERMPQQVDYEDAATPPEMPGAVMIDNSRHSTFVKWNKSFDVIKANTTVTSVHKTEFHAFEPAGDLMVCPACGCEIDAAAYESSVFGNGSVYVVAAGCIVVILGGVGAYAYANRQKSGRG